MVESIDPKVSKKPAARCSECDREMEHYNIWLGPANQKNVICWECKGREEKGFFAHRSFRRGARTGYIPR